MKELFYKGSTRFRTVTMVAALVVMVLAGCASTGANRGTLVRNRDLEKTILAYEVLPDHNYYTSGGYDLPNAILGIHKDYQLVTDLWHSIPNVNTAQMRKWIDTISPDMNYGTRGYYAAYILDPAGKKVGYWYSIQDNTVIKFLGENKIQVYTPDLFQPGDLWGNGGGTNIKIK